MWHAALRDWYLRLCVYIIYTFLLVCFCQLLVYLFTYFTIWYRWIRRKSPRYQNILALWVFGRGWYMVDYFFEKKWFCTVSFIFVWRLILWIQTNFAVCWLLCRIARKWVDVCFQPWCNPQWLIGLKAVKFSLVTLPIGSSGGHEGWIIRDPFPVFPPGGSCDQFWHGQEYPLFVVLPALPLLTAASPTLQGALKNGFGEAVVAYDTPKLCRFLSLDSCQKKFLWTYKDVDLAPHHSRWCCAPSETNGKVFSCTWFWKPGSFLFRFSWQGPCFTAVLEDEGDRILVVLKVLTS